jgi:hypothetical protein
MIVGKSQQLINNALYPVQPSQYKPLYQQSTKIKPKHPVLAGSSLDPQKINMYLPTSV